ncbi:PA2169 family four-helix-bundle protein [Flavobacteriaceae bacterium F89]|uniref:PA2169 family four-helix-bundle protein n=1 Tax=Cerina litoralis TaxID=2874477 RepID=A0AAE3EVA4_9FLAO|nr:PA2169 family four-helix-bundle protein [Cerina litoralis]MCG2460311.1 PA2169 family four-helix-bundle protein [Cerina litoralis]
MSTYREEIGEKLNALLEKTYDAEKGYKKAAEKAKQANLKAFFERKSKQRNVFGHDLKSELVSYGQEPDKGGSATGSMHRAWMDVKALFSGDNDESMLEAAITGENAAVNEYKDVLQEVNLPPSTTTLLTQQMGKIKNDLSVIKNLEDLA